MVLVCVVMVGFDSLAGPRCSITMRGDFLLIEVYVGIWVVLVTRVHDLTDDDFAALECQILKPNRLTTYLFSFLILALRDVAILLLALLLAFIT